MEETRKKEMDDNQMDETIVFRLFADYQAENSGKFRTRDDKWCANHVNNENEDSPIRKSPSQICK